MQVSSTYLRKLKFDPKLKSGFTFKFFNNPRLIILLLFSILLLGISSYITLPRNLNPEIKIPIVIVSTFLPGAGPEDIEKLVTIPIEDSISGVEGLKTTTSTSQDSVSLIQLEFESGTDADKARTDIQAAVDSAELPEDAQTPRIQKLDFENQPVWQFALISENNDTASLIRFAKRLESQISELASVNEVTTSGIEEQEIAIILKPTTIASYGLNNQQISSIIKSQIASYPAGSVQTEALSYSLTIDPVSASIDEIRQTPINIDGQVVFLGDIAIVEERPKPNQNVSYYATRDTPPRKAITFNIFRTKTVNIDRAVEDVNQVVEDSLKENKGFKIETILNTAEEIETQFRELTRDFSITIILMFVVLFIFLGIRQAVVSSLTIPLTFSISFVIMSMSGITLNFLSLFSLLLSLGLLVDDAIVVISAITSYYRTQKFTPIEAGLLVWRDFLIPILTTTITTVWAFLPLLLSSGIIGEFIKSIPIVVSSTLLASLFVALLLTLPIMILLLRPRIPRRVSLLLSIVSVLMVVSFALIFAPRNFLLPIYLLILFVLLFVTVRVRSTIKTSFKGYYSDKVSSKKRTYYKSKLSEGLVHFDVIANRYRKLILKIISTKRGRRLAITMVVIFSVFSYLLLPLGFVKNEFFPKSDQDYVYMSVELPAGTALTTSKRESQKILDELRSLPYLKFASVDTSRSFNDTQGPAGGGGNNLLFNIVLTKHRSIEIGEILRSKYASYPDGVVTITESSGGPPAGADLQIKLFGENLQRLDSYSNSVVTYLEQQNGVTDISKSIKTGTGKVTFIPDRLKLAQNNLTIDQVGFLMRTFASGFKVDDISLEDSLSENPDITIRISENVQTPENIDQLFVTTQSGEKILLSSLGHLSLKPNPTLITREDSRRTLSVSASVRQGFSISSINQGLENFANSLNLPEGYSWSTGGVNEENQNSVNSILQAMLLSFLLIVITMVIQFSSFRKALIVMMVIPLSISGVFIIFALTNTPLSFPALIGVLALFGIVVKNSILIVDKIGQNERAGMSYIEAIIDGAASRLEAIALTSFCAIAGLIPITLSDPLWRGLGGAIIAGLSFSGTIMLFFIPIIYYYWMKDEDKSRKKTSS